MMYSATLSVPRRVFLPSVASRLIFTRLISSTPVFDAPTEASATKASAPQKAAKASAKPKVNIEKKKKDVKAANKPAKFTLKDLKVPKRPGSRPWSIFTKDNLTGVKKSVTDIHTDLRGLAEKWKNMTEAEKKPFYDRAKKSNEEIEKQYAEWKKNVDPSVVRAINKKRKANGKPRIIVPNTGPKKPLTSFIRFCMDLRKQQDSSVTFRELLKQAGSAWRDLSEERKKPYIEAYAKDYQAYRQQTSA